MHSTIELYCISFDFWTWSVVNFDQMASKVNWKVSILLFRHEMLLASWAFNKESHFKNIYRKFKRKTTLPEPSATWKYQRLAFCLQFLCVDLQHCEKVIKFTKTNRNFNHFYHTHFQKMIKSWTPDELYSSLPTTLAIELLKLNRE